MESDGEIEISSSKRRSKRRSSSRDRDREHRREKKSSRDEKKSSREERRDKRRSRSVSKERERERDRTSSRGGHKEKRRSSSRDLEDRQVSTKDHKERRRSRERDLDDRSVSTKEYKEKRRSRSRDLDDRSVSKEHISRGGHKEKRRSPSRELDDRPISTKEHKKRRRSRSQSRDLEDRPVSTKDHKERRRSRSEARDLEDRPVSTKEHKERRRSRDLEDRQVSTKEHKERRRSRSESRDLDDRPVSKEHTSRGGHKEKRRSSSRDLEDRQVPTKEHKERRRSRSESRDLDDRPVPTKEHKEKRRSREREKERKGRSTSRDREEKKKKSSKDHKRKRSSSRERKRDRKEDKRSRRDERKRRSSSNEEDNADDDDYRRRSERKKSKNSEPEEPKKEVKPATEVFKPPTMGAYIPPAKLRMMQNAIEDKSSASYQRIAWEALKKSINGLINKVNVSNISVIVRELFKENLIRGRGLLCRAIMQAQSASATYTNVFAALVSIINTKFPNIGELLLKRLILQFRRGYKRNDKTSCLAAVKFIAHLVNQQVAHEVLGLEILTLLLEHPTAHSVEVAIAFLKEIGARLDDVSPRGSHAIFERLRHVLHEGDLEKRVQYMIEVMFQIRKDKYKQFPSVPEELDLVEEEDQFTHLVTLDEVVEGEEMLNVFKLDEEYLANEEKYALLRKEILDEDEENDDEEGGDEDDEDESGEEEEDETNEKDEDGKQIIHDKTETNLLTLRRTIYLTIQSSLDFEECCHKLLKLNLPEGQESELCHMILDCCAQQRTYEKFFGLLAGRFCNIHQKYVNPFETIFKDTYDTVHRLDTNKLRNVAKFFAHLLFTDAMSWAILEHIHLTEEETTSSSRIFVKILFQELSEYMGLSKLNGRLRDATLKPFFEGLFPRDNPKDSRFSINFFTSIGLGGLTDELREHLKPKSKPEKLQL